MTSERPIRSGSQAGAAPNEMPDGPEPAVEAEAPATHAPGAAPGQVSQEECERILHERRSLRERFDAVEEEDMPRVHVTRNRLIAGGIFIVSVAAFLYFVLPQLSGVKGTWDRLAEGNAWWLGVAAAMQVVSMASYIAIFQGIHVPPGSPISYRDSYKITMASLAATRLFAAGGAGGVVLTAWALRRSGMDRREVAERMIAFLVIMYLVYMVAMVVCGLGLRTHLFHGPNPFAVTVVPAILGIAVIVVFLAIGLVPEDLERRLGRFTPKNQRLAGLLRRLATGPASLSGGVRFALYKLRHPDWALLGTVGWWAFNIGVLYACFRAFGEPPPVAVLIQAYFVGLLANLLPVPGGIGAVDGGMIGAFAAFGVSGSLALVAVLMYRLFAFWLPSVPGLVAYFQLRRTVREWVGEVARARTEAHRRPAPA
ncbi:MAG: flippase-like domain-containing protein [Actinobacteria bacterium]|nr:MAG: flippase-like domain-containing protein [Actinomycetota bacterium]